MFAIASDAAPVVPNDDAVVEHLPARLVGIPRLLRDAVDRITPGADAVQARRARPEQAAARARALLDQARDRGDPRYAGYALATIASWRDDPQPPSSIAILAATLAQYQHDFDGSRRMLEAVLARDPGNPQATLTLATIARVQGRYDVSDRWCGQVAVDLYREACLAENAGLRGGFDDARRRLAVLLARPDLQGAAGAGARQWLTTTVAELDERAGRDESAEEAYRQALATGRDSYLTLDYADFLIAHRRYDEAARLLEAEPKPFGDGVLLRLAIVRKESKGADAEAMATELRERFDAARQRGDAVSIHGRELARAQATVLGEARAAVVVARENLRIQKEAADFIVLAQAAHAAKDRSALQEAATQAKAIGLVDRRLDAIVGNDVGF